MPTSRQRLQPPRCTRVPHSHPTGIPDRMVKFTNMKINSGANIAKATGTPCKPSSANTRTVPGHSKDPRHNIGKDGCRHTKRPSAGANWTAKTWHAWKAWIITANTGCKMKPVNKCTDQPDNDFAHVCNLERSISVSMIADYNALTSSRIEPIMLCRSHQSQILIKE